MKLAGSLCLTAILAGGAFAQNITRSFGSVVFPGGTSATNPNITRTFGSVVFPGGSPTSPPVRSGPSLVAPPSFNGGNTFNRGGFNGGNTFTPGPRTPPVNRGRKGSQTSVYAYPVYVPSYFDPSLSQGFAPQTQPEQPPNVTVVYPQQQEPRPIIIQMAPDGSYTQAQRPSSAPAYVSPDQAADTEPDTPHYLIAFKDHSIYTSVAYWFDGDTLHYFTKGDTHNQAPVALIDRDLTERLNRELGIDFKMPPAR